MPLPGKATDNPIDALAGELEAARALLAAQRALEGALTGGAGSEEVQLRVRQQEDAVRGLHAAALARRFFLPGPGTLDQFAQGRPAAEAERLRSMGREAVELREKIRQSARRADYLARRGVEWTRAQVEIVVRAVSGPAVTYDAPGASGRPRRAPSLLDRSA